MMSNLPLVALILPLAFANPLEIVKSTEALSKSIEDNSKEEIAQFNFGYSIQVLCIYFLVIYSLLPILEIPMLKI